MVHVPITGIRPHTFLRGALLTSALCLLVACGGGSTSAPYAGAAPTSGGTTGSSGGTGTTGGTGGGGAGGAAGPDLLFASSYIAYPTQTNGAFLHSVQGGDVYTGGGGSFSYTVTGGYSSPQSAMNATGLYIFQEQAGNAAPVTSGDYVYVAVSAPGNGTADIAQATTLLVQMGNSVTPGASAGHATKFTVDINNAKGTTAATGDCSFDQTLAAVGTNVAGPPGSALGVRTYAIPLSSFTCSVGSIAGLQSSGITTVAVKFTGDRNTAMTANEIDNINIGMIGFTGTVSSANAAALGQ